MSFEQQKLQLYMKVNEKIIDNYKLIETQRILPSGVHIIQAEEIKTSTIFTMKKACITFQENALDCPSSQGYDSLIREINILQDLNVPRVIKCHKFLKTKRNIYAVFDEYPQLQLAEYIEKYHPSIGQRMNIAHTICQTLINIHKKGYIFTNLHPGCILINLKDNNIKFVGLESCLRIEETSIKHLRYQNSFMAPQLRHQKKVSLLADSYSFGKILQTLQICETFDPDKKNHFNAPIQNILESLTSEKPEIRASLQTVMLCLQLKYNYNSTNESLNQNNYSEKQKKYVSLKNITASSKKSNKNTKSKSRKLQPLQPSKELLHKNKIKKIIKIRNLSLFLVDQAQFCIKQGAYILSYLLFKKSIIICGNILHSLKQDHIKTDTFKYIDYNSILLILQQQYDKYHVFQAKIQKFLRASQKEDTQDSHIFSEQYLQESIRQFIKQKRSLMNLQYSSEKRKNRNKLEHLYCLSEKLSYGSFQKFFEDGIHEEEIKLSSQKYFKYIQTLTTKELTQKVDLALEK